MKRLKVLSLVASGLWTIFNLQLQPRWPFVEALLKLNGLQHFQFACSGSTFGPFGVTERPPADLVTVIWIRTRSHLTWKLFRMSCNAIAKKKLGGEDLRGWRLENGFEKDTSKIAKEIIQFRVVKEEARGGCRTEYQLLCLDVSQPIGSNYRRLVLRLMYQTQDWLSKFDESHCGTSTPCRVTSNPVAKP
jgi:hypothetical protein